VKISVAGQLKEVFCDVCGDVPSRELLKLHDSAYHECTNCSLIYAKWVLQDYVEANEAAFANELEDYVRKASDERRVRKLEKELGAYSNYRKTNKFLEVGCNAGSVLLTARNLGWDVHGVDISAAATEFGRTKWDLNLHTGTLESAHYDDDTFDVIFSNATLEHVEHPLSTLKEVSRVLRPGGIFYCNTVNWDSYTRQILNENWFLIAPTHHIHLFTPKNVVMLCEKSGLAHLKTWTTGARVQANAPESTFVTPWYLNLMKGPLSMLTRLTKKGDSIYFTATKTS
jgi:2-polyprenyl-3-methyl-5-hydroxy-6-metoxy-1,4-benzoquinol methylase